MTTVLYLHGFLSSPESVKAKQTLEYAKQYLPDVEIVIPQIPNTIDAAVSSLKSLVKQHFIQPGKPILCIGSSMGGFLSNWLVETYAGHSESKAVLVNPAVAPYNLMLNYLGEHTNPYSGERFCVDADHIDVLRALEPTSCNNPSSYKLLLQTGDEVLDYKLAVERYKGANVIIEEGGDHSFINFERHLNDVFRFLLS